jgi:hypothetical protein
MVSAQAKLRSVAGCVLHVWRVDGVPEETYAKRNGCNSPALNIAVAAGCESLMVTDLLAIISGHCWLHCVVRFWDSWDFVFHEQFGPQQLQ